MTVRAVLVVFIAGMLWLPASLVAQDNLPGVTIHVVQRGETLFRIALDYGLTTDDLARLNGIIDVNNIQVGQRLLVPATDGELVLLPAQTHTVQPGESLQSIAALYGVDALELAGRNGVSAENPLYVGQILTITPPTAIASAPEEAVAAAEPPPGVIHTVLDGETLFRIATQYGVTVADVAAANNIADPTLIFAGQQVLIPGVQPPQLALDVPAFVTGFTADPLVFIEGQTGRIRLTTAASVTVTGTFLERALNDGLEQGNTVHSLLVGVPMFTTPGVYPLALTLADEAGSQFPVAANIQVVGGSYGSESINLLDGRNELLDPGLEDAELALLQTMMTTFTPTRYFDGPMSLPAAAAVTSPYGTRRSYNGGGFDRYHGGADFAGAPGSPVLAAAPGRVVMADTLAVRGNATVIDHGWGVFTVYCHQMEMYVRPGEMVQTGQVIGTVGATGRVTGTHLHWEVWVNGVQVDPMQWVRQSFS